MTLLIAGPCLLQSVDDIELAKKIKEAGADVFRAKRFNAEGTFKPTNPFTGFIDDVHIFSEIHKFMPTATEFHIKQQKHLDLFDYIWTPARQMQNYEYLKHLNKNCANKPIIMKRHFGCTIKETIGATSYLRNVKDLYICERGINTFDRRKYARWIPDFRGMLELKKEGYKVIFDVSHSCGDGSYVVPMVKAALQLGIDGVMVEVRDNVALAVSDREQHINLEGLKEIAEYIKGGR